MSLSLPNSSLDRKISVSIQDGNDLIPLTQNIIGSNITLPIYTQSQRIANILDEYRSDFSFGIGLASRVLSSYIAVQSDLANIIALTGTIGLILTKELEDQSPLATAEITAVIVTSGISSLITGIYLQTPGIAGLLSTYAGGAFGTSSLTLSKKSITYLIDYLRS